MTPQYVSRAEAAVLCRRSERTIDRWIRAGKLPAIKLPAEMGCSFLGLPWSSR